MVDPMATRNVRLETAGHAIELPTGPKNALLTCALREFKSIINEKDT